MENAIKLAWEPETLFSLDGNQFSQLHNSLKFIVETETFKQKLEEARIITAIGQMYDMSNSVLNKGIESGIVTKEEVNNSPVVEPTMDSVNTQPKSNGLVEDTVHVML